MKRFLLSSVLGSTLGIAVISACGGGGKSTTATQAPRGGSTDDPSCPVAVPGTSVTVEDTNSGAALVFVTTGDAGELRKRAAAMAAMHNDHHGSMGALPDGTNAGDGHAGHDMSGHAGHDMGSGSAPQGHAGHDMGSGNAPQSHAGHDMGNHSGHAGGMIGVHSKADSVDVEGGAKVVFTASAADVAKLQAELRMHAQHMSNGTCAMGRS